MSLPAGGVLYKFQRAREIMREHHLQYLPVVDDNSRVIGIVALRDLAAERQQRNK